MFCATGVGFCIDLPHQLGGEVIGGITYAVRSRGDVQVISDDQDAYNFRRSQLNRSQRSDHACSGVGVRLMAFRFPLAAPF